MSATWQVIHGDCLEVMRGMASGSVDAVVTDPPYGIAHASNHTCDTTTAQWMNREIRGDSDTHARDEVLAWCGDRPWAFFGSIKQSVPANTRGTLIWDKGPASGMGDLSFPWKPSWELIFVGGDGWAGSRDEAVLKNHWIVTRASMGRVHPNEKPVSLMRAIVEKLPEGCTVLDPFCGSGTTGVACVQTGRRFIGVEIDEKYAAIARRRIAEADAAQLFRPKVEPLPDPEMFPAKEPAQ